MGQDFHFVSMQHQALNGLSPRYVVIIWNIVSEGHKVKGKLVVVYKPVVGACCISSGDMKRTLPIRYLGALLGRGVQADTGSPVVLIRDTSTAFSLRC